MAGSSRISSLPQSARRFSPANCATSKRDTASVPASLSWPPSPPSPAWQCTGARHPFVQPKELGFSGSRSHRGPVQPVRFREPAQVHAGKVRS